MITNVIRVKEGDIIRAIGGGYPPHIVPGEDYVVLKIHQSPSVLEGGNAYLDHCGSGKPCTCTDNYWCLYDEKFEPKPLTENEIKQAVSLPPLENVKEFMRQRICP